MAVFDFVVGFGSLFPSWSALSMAQFSYPHCCSSAALSLTLVTIESAPWNKVSATPSFCIRECVLRKLKILVSVCLFSIDSNWQSAVFFNSYKTVKKKELIVRQSFQGELNLASMLLICWKKLSSSFVLIKTQVSSTYLNHLYTRHYTVVGCKCSSLKFYLTLGTEL